MNTNDELNEEIKKEMQARFNAMTVEERQEFVTKLTESINNLAKATVDNADAIWNYYNGPNGVNKSDNS